MEKLNSPEEFNSPLININELKELYNEFVGKYNKLQRYIKESADRIPDADERGRDPKYNYAIGRFFGAKEIIEAFEAKINTIELIFNMESSSQITNVPYASIEELIELHDEFVKKYDTLQKFIELSGDRIIDPDQRAIDPTYNYAIGKFFGAKEIIEAFEAKILVTKALYDMEDEQLNNPSDVIDLNKNF